jgi:hypothetical protein
MIVTSAEFAYDRPAGLGLRPHVQLDLKYSLKFRGLSITLPECACRQAAACAWRCATDVDIVMMRGPFLLITLAI